MNERFCDLPPLLGRHPRILARAVITLAERTYGFVTLRGSNTEPACQRQKRRGLSMFVSMFVSMLLPVQVGSLLPSRNLAWAWRPSFAPKRNTRGEPAAIA
jgi:hypothetical protein